MRPPPLTHQPLIRRNTEPSKAQSRTPHTTQLVVAVGALRLVEVPSKLKEANANCVMGHRRQFLAELVVATIVADGAEGNTCCSVSHCAVRLSDPSQLA